MQFSGAVAGPFTINYSKADSCNVSAWAQDAEAQAQAKGIDLASYTRKVYVLPTDNSCGYAGLGTVGGNPSKAWIFMCEYPDIFAHELGHNLGMGHAGDMIDQYNDTSDIMGYSGIGLRQINGAHQDQMGWRAQKITEITADGIYDIAAIELDATSAGSTPQVLKIRKPDTADWYYVSLRKPIGFDMTLSPSYLNNLSIHRYAGNGSSSKTTWLDTLADGGSYNDSVNGIFITQIGANFDGSVSVQVDLSTTCTRNAPTVAVTPQSQTDSAGASLNYDLTITNNDTASCSASDLSLATNIPAGWSDALSSNLVTIAPGNKATIKWQVSSSNTSADGNYGLAAAVADTATIAHDTTIAANYTVSTPSDTTSPSAPANLKAAAQRKQISVSWQAATDNVAVAGYKIFRNNVLIATTSSTGYTDTTGLQSGITYTYNATAFDAAKNESPASNSSSVTFGSTGAKRR